MAFFGNRDLARNCGFLIGDLKSRAVEGSASGWNRRRPDPGSCRICHCIFLLSTNAILPLFLGSHSTMFASLILRNSSTSTGASAFSHAHKAYVKSLYRRYLKNELDWCIRRDVWRDRAIEIRVAFERNRNIRNPRELANLFEKAERELKTRQHPDPHRRKSASPCPSRSPTAMAKHMHWSQRTDHCDGKSKRSVSDHAALNTDLTNPIFA